MTIGTRWGEQAHSCQTGVVMPQNHRNTAFREEAALESYMLYVCCACVVTFIPAAWPPLTASVCVGS